jgi:hypothetical protein
MEKMGVGEGIGGGDCSDNASDNVSDVGGSMDVSR